ncbi:DUF222 domain-containing protein [Nocardioides sp. JQ2195]|uniref:HNH endonuclease signature motif containing protein n=1 Tax=Nocardioides sp. JQ2195 TaxID=2592334 RepID=UPI00143E557F|nr:HNH endonuclease signature motif containing protein [Nocardioides sp. JQ2195]QIX27146.1 DUF222 domain-containing protein [Nocardioides sp. JQ2195]
MTESLGSVRDAISAMGEFEPLYVPEPQKRELLRGLAAAQAQLAAVRLKVMAVAGDVAARDGAKDVATWMAADHRIAPAEARTDLALATTFDVRWQATAAALAAGDVHLDQARAIADALDGTRDDLSATKLLEAEQIMLTAAKKLDAAGLRKLGRGLADVVDPDAAEEREAKRLAEEEKHAAEKAKLTLTPKGDGTTRIAGVLPNAVARRLSTCLEAFAQPRKQAAESDGRRVPHSRLLARALGDLLERIDPSRLPDHGGDATTVIVTLSLEQLRTDLASAGIGFNDDVAMTAATARRLACQAQIIPVVLGGEGQILDAGRRSRLHHPMQRKMIRLRDGQCQAAGCTVKAEWCEIHHLVPWSHGGKTSVKDGVLLCSHHHHRVHDQAYLHERQPDGSFRFTRRT